MTQIPGKPSYRTLTAEEFGRLPNAEFCAVVESILSDPVRNESVIRMLAVSDGDLEDIVKNQAHCRSDAPCRFITEAFLSTPRLPCGQGRRLSNA